MKTPFLAAMMWLVAQGTGWTLTIQLDFTYDTFFAAHPTALISLQRAAQEVSTVVLSNFPAVTQDQFTGTSNGTTATIDWELDFVNPTTGADVILDNFTIPANTVRIYVGMRNLSGNTLGQGGPANLGLGINFSGVGGGETAALNAAEAASNAMLRRSPGPVIGRYVDPDYAGGFDVAYGTLAGNLWFDQDTDNDTFTDNDNLLNSFWNFDPNAPVLGKNDFFSVAVHEMLHAIGFGTSDTWTALHPTGGDWIGAKGKALDPDGGLNLVGSGHLREGYISKSLHDGLAQEAEMDPSLTTGRRKYITEMDAAILSDLGFATIPEPGCAGLLALGVVAMGARRWRGMVGQRGLARAVIGAADCGKRLASGGGAQG